MTRNDERGPEGPDGAFAPLLVTRALAGAIGIRGVTVGLPTGRPGPLLVGPLVTAVGVGAAWPRTEWFPERRHGRRPGTEGDRT